MDRLEREKGHEGPNEGGGRIERPLRRDPGRGRTGQGPGLGQGHEIRGTIGLPAFRAGGSHSGEIEMKYYKTAMFVPGKGQAWMFSEADENMKVHRTLTHIPMTNEIERIPDPVVKVLFM